MRMRERELLRDISDTRLHICRASLSDTIAYVGIRQHTPPHERAANTEAYADKETLLCRMQGFSIRHPPMRDMEVGVW